MTEKPKIGNDCNYVIALSELDDVTKSMIFDDIFAINEHPQLSEWKNLFEGHHTKYLRIESFDRQNLETIPHLPIDTKNFSSEMKYQILSSINDIEDKTNGILIEGENLQVLNSLKDQYREKVKTIYIDPPYNTGNTKFPYCDKFKRSDWLKMMRDRLEVAKEFLRKDGVIFVSIDDNEQAYLKVLMDEVFDSGNFIGNFIWKSKSGGANDSRLVAIDHEYCLCFGLNFDSVVFGRNDLIISTTSYNNKDDKGRFALERLDKQSLGYRESLDFPIYDSFGNKHLPKSKNLEIKQATWRWSKQEVENRYDELVFKNGCVYTKNYEKDDTKTRSLLTEKIYGRTRTGTVEISHLVGINKFSYPKNERLISFFLKTSSNNNNLVLDFFLGSGTTTSVAHKTNRKYIGVEASAKTFNEVAVKRMKYVVFGEEGGISKYADWKGGGMFKYYKLD